MLTIMKNRKKTQERNWFLVFIALILLILGLALIILAMSNINSFGWMSLVIGISGLTIVSAATASIVTNDPSWIMLDLFIPG